MSMQANLPENDNTTNDKNKDDTIYWPLTLNIPGEGFGDDSLQTYSHHELLDEDVTEPFLLDEALEKAGGSCPEMDRGEGADGPPTGQAEHVPSNLEIDPNSWVSNVYTFSPVWEPKVSLPSSITVASDEASTISNSGNEDGWAYTQAGPSTQVASCVDPFTDLIQFKITFDNLEILEEESIPWLSLAFRPDSECLMSPRGGGDQDALFLLSSTIEKKEAFAAAASLVSSETTAHIGSLSPSLKSFDNNVVSSLQNSLSPLSGSPDYDQVQVVTELNNDQDTASVLLSFQYNVKSRLSSSPLETLHMTYAIGRTSEIGYHATRACFEVVDFPTCATATSTDTEKVVSTSETVVPKSSSTRQSVEVALQFNSFWIPVMVSAVMYTLAI